MEFSVTKKDKLMVIFSAILGFLFWDFFLGGFSLSMVAYLMVLYPIVLWYFHKKGEHLSKSGLLLFIPIILLVLCFLLFSNPLLKFFNTCLLFFLVVLQLGVLTFNTKSRIFSLGTLKDLMFLTFATPVINFVSGVKVLGDGSENSVGKRRAFQIIIAVIISIPILLIVIALLMSADRNFQVLFEKINNYIAKNMGEYILKTILGIMLAFPLFGFLFGLKNKKTAQNKGVDPSFITKANRVDNIFIITILAMLTGIYALFIGLQFSYLIGGFMGTLPKTFIISEYARRGFFEMEAVAIINFGLLILTFILAKRVDGKIKKATKTFFIGLVALTVLLLGTAFSKMVMYVNIYGLTQLRIYTSWFMLFTMIVFFALAMKLFKKNFSFFRFSTITFLVLYLTLNFACVDYIIPKYNIEQYKSKKLKTLDVMMMRNLSNEMMPAIAELLEDKDETIKKQAQYVFAFRAVQLKEVKNWQQFDMFTLKAKQLAKDKNVAMPKDFEPNKYERFND